MEYKLNFVADRVIKRRIYPAFAKWSAYPYTQEWRQFEQHWPYTVPLRLQEYCDTEHIMIDTYTIDDQLPNNSFYPVGLGFFDFGIDYFALMSKDLVRRLRQEQLRVLFYYHEGDNPFRIKDRLDELCQNHLMPSDCYVFVSGNSAANQLPGFVYFSDFEQWYLHRNHNQGALAIHSEPRERDFTALSRLHKSWRATAMTDMLCHHILDNSYWSYCETGALNDEDNPIEIDSIDNLRVSTKKFLEDGPYVSDELNNDDRNDHAKVESKYFVNAYCNIVLETHFDADQSGGAFITEKTYKPIKHGQLFFIIGAPGSLQVLRELGYRTFDHVLDNSYDLEQNNTRRWIKLRNAIANAQMNLPTLFEQARDDIIHNQQLFLAQKSTRLNNLIKEIYEQHN